MLPTSTTDNIVVVTEFATAVVYVTVTPTLTAAVSSDSGASSSSVAGDYGYGSTAQSGVINTSEMAGEADFAGGIPVAKRARRHHSHNHRHAQVLA